MANPDTIAERILGGRTLNEFLTAAFEKSQKTLRLSNAERFERISKMDRLPEADLLWEETNKARQDKLKR